MGTDVEGWGPTWQFAGFFDVGCYVCVLGVSASTGRTRIRLLCLGLGSTRILPPCLAN